MAKKTRLPAYTVETFCNGAKSEATKKNYYYSLLHYARFLFKDKDPKIVIPALNSRVAEPHNPGPDMALYEQSMRGEPPKSVNLRLTAVRMFYEINGNAINRIEMKRLKQKTDVVTEQGILTTDILKKMVNAADVRGRCLIMLLASTGCRLGELCEVKLEDLDMTKNPPRIVLKSEYTKNGRTRLVFLTDEARDVVSVWLNGERAKYLETSFARNQGLNDQFRDKNRLPPEQDRRLLGLSTAAARQIWYHIISKVMDKGKLTRDKKTHIHPFSPHTVRKWWRVTAMQGMKNPDVCNLILGHWDHALDAVYARIHDDGLAAEFLKGQYALAIMSGEAVREIQERVDLQGAQSAAQQRELDKLRKELTSTQEQLAAQQVKFQEFSELAIRVMQDADANREYQFNLMRDPDTPPPLRLDPKQVQRTWDKASIEAAKKSRKK